MTPENVPENHPNKKKTETNRHKTRDNIFSPQNSVYKQQLATLGGQDEAEGAPSLRLLVEPHSPEMASLSTRGNSAPGPLAHSADEIRDTHRGARAARENWIKGRVKRGIG